MLNIARDLGSQPHLSGNLETHRRLFVGLLKVSSIVNQEFSFSLHLSVCLLVRSVSAYLYSLSPAAELLAYPKIPAETVA